MSKDNPLASEYIEQIEVLRYMGLTWAEISDWFKAKKLDFSKAALQSAWHKHTTRKHNAEVKPK